MSRGIWAMMTLLEVFDCSFSDSLVHKFSAPEKKTTVSQSDATGTIKHFQHPSDYDFSEHTALLQLITLLIFDSPHHEVHAGSVGLATKLEGTLFPRQPPCVMKYPLQLWLTAAKLFQYKVMHFTYKCRVQGCETQSMEIWQSSLLIKPHNTTIITGPGSFTA